MVKSGRKVESDVGLGKVVQTAVFIGNRGCIATILTMREHNDGTYSFEKVDIAEGAIHTSYLREYCDFRYEVRKLKKVFGHYLTDRKDPSARMIAPFHTHFGR